MIEQVARESPPISWEKFFKDAAPELTHISRLLDVEKKLGTYYPTKRIFNAFHLTKSTDVKVIIIGNEPYALPNQDQGLAFSVKEDDDIPLAVKEIHKELNATVKGFKTPNHGSLASWAKQGVLLLNQSLTISPGRSHLEYELWYGFLNKLFKFINTINPDTIVVQWGQKAQNINDLLPDSFIKLEAGYPGGFQTKTPFTGCNHFNKINEILIKQKRTPICWQL